MAHQRDCTRIVQCGSHEVFPIIYIVNKYMIELFLRGMCGLSHLFYTVLISFRIRASYSMNGRNIAIHFILISKLVEAVYEV